MDYPLEVSFKLLAIAQQFAVRDAKGKLVFYAKQKAFRLKEQVTIFADEEQTRSLYTIRADRVLDISARYDFFDQTGQLIGSVKRHGMRSIWRARYDISGVGGIALTIREEKALTKMLDALFGEIPLLGIFSGYLFNPAYEVSRSNGALVLRVEKRPAFFESRFAIQRHAEMTPQEEICALLGVVMMLLLERRRG